MSLRPPSFGLFAAVAVAALAVGALLVGVPTPERLHADPPGSGLASGPRAVVAGDLEPALERTAPAIVTIQLLLKFAEDGEYAAYARGALIDPDGLVLLSDDELGGADTTLKEVKVLVGADLRGLQGDAKELKGDAKERPAVLVARDRTLHLAYLRILPGEGRPFPFVDLAAAAAARTAPPRLGETLYGVTRMGRGFDYAPAVRRLYFTCRITSPRPLFDFTGEFGEPGLPVFDLEGRAVAVFANQPGAEGADEHGGTTHETFALPLAPVLKSIEAARKRVPEALEKAAKSAAPDDR